MFSPEHLVGTFRLLFFLFLFCTVLPERDHRVCSSSYNCRFVGADSKRPDLTTHLNQLPAERLHTYFVFVVIQGRRTCFLPHVP